MIATSEVQGAGLMIITTCTLISKTAVRYIPFSITQTPYGRGLPVDALPAGFTLRQEEVIERNAGV